MIRISINDKNKQNKNMIIPIITQPGGWGNVVTTVRSSLNDTNQGQ